MGQLHESSRDLEQAAWWGTFKLSPGEAGCWQVGPTTFWLRRTLREWRVAYLQERKQNSGSVKVAVPADAAKMDEFTASNGNEALVHRYPFEKTTPTVNVCPALADRSVIVRPETPLYILPGEAVTLYVSTPLWIHLETGRPVRFLQEMPVYRPSDTWFGPSTREGELCYAARTSGRLNLENESLRLDRAVTPVKVRNRAEDALQLERLQLPVQYLSLFQGPNSFLWTQTVILNRQHENNLALVQLGQGAPEEIAKARKIRGPREASKDNLILRTFGAFSALFS